MHVISQFYIHFYFSYKHYEGEVYLVMMISVFILLKLNA